MSRPKLIERLDMPMIYMHPRHTISECAELGRDDEVMVDSEGWSVHLVRLSEYGVRADDAGRGQYRLTIARPSGSTAYSSDAMYLHDWHDPIEQAAGWAVALLDSESGYGDDAPEGDEWVRVQRLRAELEALPNGAHVLDGFQMVAMDREG